MDKNELKEVLLEVEKEKKNMARPGQPAGEPTDWVGLAQKAWAGKKFIMMVTAGFMVIGLIAALLTTKVYTSTVTLVPELGKSSSSSTLSSVTSMLGLGGAIGGASADAYNVTVYPEVVASTPFVTKLFDIRVTDEEEEIEVFSPSPCLIEKAAGQWRWHVLLRSQSISRLLSFTKNLLSSFILPSSLHLEVDVDPTSLF